MPAGEYIASFWGHPLGVTKRGLAPLRLRDGWYLQEQVPTWGNQVADQWWNWSGAMYVSHSDDPKQTWGLQVKPTYTLAELGKRNASVRAVRSSYVTLRCMYVYIYIWSCESCVPCSYPPSNGMGPQVAPPSPLFASYWQHFWGPASYLVGFCSDCDYQPRIY